MKTTECQPTESGPATIDGTRGGHLKCRVCKQHFVDGDSVYYVGRDYIGAQYVRHVTCARPAPKAKKTPRGDATARNGRVIRSTRGMS